MLPLIENRGQALMTGEVHVPASSAGPCKLPLLQVKQKGGTVEQVVIADMAFDVLKVAWGKFEATELRK